MPITHLYRYPVKGLSAEALAHADLEPDHAIAWDRAFALALGDTDFDETNPAWQPKSRFMCLLKHASIAALSCRFDAASGDMTIRSAASEVCASALTASGRADIGAWLTAYLGEEAKGKARFVYAPGHVFADQRGPVVTFINLASLAALEASAGAAREKMRFRSNIYFEGSPAWSEFDWVGRDIRVGDAVLRVVERTERCAATDVNPGTAERDAKPVKELLAGFGHPDLGVHARVVVGGRIALGSTIALE